MDATRFDRWARTLAVTRSRRQAIAALLLGGAALTRSSFDSAAGPGCKNVGKKCQKKKDCCSGVCKGKKRRKKCKAHDATTCLAGEQEVICGGLDSDTATCTTSAGDPGFCNTTTGNAGYCTSSSVCFTCSEDADCREICGEQAACIQCAAECTSTGNTACAGTEACIPI